MRTATEKRTAPQRAPRRKGGFTLTELVVVVAVGAVLAGVLVADLSQTRSKLLQQACATNLKHWGMVMALYSEDYRGYILDDITHWESANWGSVTNPYLRYIGGGDPGVEMRIMRICPAVAATMTSDQILNPAPNAKVYSYNICTPFHLVNGVYQASLGESIAHSVKSARNPAVFLILIDAPHNYTFAGHTGLLSKIRQIQDRHLGGMNLLFADWHVQYMLYSAITNHCAQYTDSHEPWFQMD